MDNPGEPPDPGESSPAGTTRLAAAGRLLSRVRNSARRRWDGATNALAQRAVQSANPNSSSNPTQTSVNQSMSQTSNQTTAPRSAPEPRANINTVQTRTTVTPTGNNLPPLEGNNLPPLEPLELPQDVEAETPASEMRTTRLLFNSPETPVGVTTPSVRENDDTASTRRWVSELELDVIANFIQMEGEEQQKIHDQFEQLTSVGVPMERCLEYAANIIAKSGTIFNTE